MEKLKLITQASPWLILVCVAIGLAYALLLYSKKANWSKTTNRILGTLRFVLVTILCLLLLLNPYLRQVSNTIEKPTVVFAIDNSQSIATTNDSVKIRNLYKELENLGDALKKDNVNIDIQNLDITSIAKNIVQTPLNFASSNLSAILNTIKNNYENRNLDKVVLVSDGIYNQGISPVFQDYSFPVYTVGVGDTTQKRDIKLAAVLANKVAYLGNKFPVVAEVENIGYPGRSVNVYLSQNGQVLGRKRVTFKEDGELQQVTFLTEAKYKGMQRYMVYVDALENEFTKTNNARDVYIEVIDGKEKILVIAPTPHPDIKALKSAITKNDNYSFDMHIPGITKLKNEKYDLIIAHQVPNIYRNGRNLLARFRKQGTPIFYILGSQSDLNTFNSLNAGLRINRRGRQMDEVTPIFNDKFNTFNFEREKVKVFKKLPPASVPFGSYGVSNSAQVILHQRVGSIETSKPLLVINELNGVKSAVMAGEGLWEWRQEEYALNEKHEIVDEIVSKVVQYLSTKEDKRRLRVYPINNEFYDFEKVVFETEMYNKLYERIYDVKVNLTLTNEKGKTSTYSFTPTEGSSRFEISGLSKGVYKYSAAATIKNKNEVSGGEFTIKSLQLEALNNTADHNLLRQLSKKTAGRFFTMNQTAELKKAVLDTRKPNVLHSTEEIQEMIHLKWIFFVLMALATIEWVTRKYQGGY
ncbi:vWA domain-containing protein [Microscilla marina]|uniref:VWA domain-containing protein n=1 Tax=Microscilla marina ATCC 23134 TaxID=313606 RepID=A1ZF88_MICM2|nr:vWA domain-containing protein [Microscilla marina]EAY31190.1 hypothetical protein M23134_07600 [Microscilla marina ATCC 23134]